MRAERFPGRVAPLPGRLQSVKTTLSFLLLLVAACSAPRAYEGRLPRDQVATIKVSSTRVWRDKLKHLAEDVTGPAIVYEARILSVGDYDYKGAKEVKVKAGAHLVEIEWTRRIQTVSNVATVNEAISDRGTRLMSIVVGGGKTYRLVWDAVPETSGMIDEPIMGFDEG